MEPKELFAAQRDAEVLESCGLSLDLSGIEYAQDLVQALEWLDDCGIEIPIDRKLPSGQHEFIQVTPRRNLNRAA